jgi:hypothetical protein
MNTAAASVISASALLAATWNKIRKTSEFFRKLSPKAEKNWHQNRGAKRRVRSKDDEEDISSFHSVRERRTCRAHYTDKWGKTTTGLARMERMQHPG